MVLWVFGYGSLIWNPGFDFDERIIGYIKNYRRVFDLEFCGPLLCELLDLDPCCTPEDLSLSHTSSLHAACLDHRGTPDHPARTLTLEYSDESICWGTAYCVRGGAEKETMAMQYLERRECKYDQKTHVEFYAEDGDRLEPAVRGVLVFTSTPDRVVNKYYLGPAPLEEMARQIATASGPCGNNRDYIFKLEKALFDIGHQEKSVNELADEVRKVLHRMKEKKLIGEEIALKTHLSPVHLLPLAETTATESS